MSEKKDIKIMVVSSKGGVGKSTISMQLVAPYLYERCNKTVAYYEFDDENCDALSYGASELTKREVVCVDPIVLKENLIEICSKKESACMDIGGNKTTTMVLNALNETGMIHFIDLAVIPLLDGEQDGINASIVYSILKDAKSDMKFVFVLNRAKNQRYIKYQFDNFFGDVRGILSDTHSIKNYLFDGELENYTVMLDDDIIKYSRRFGLTIYEIAKMKRDFEKDLKLKKESLSADEEVKVISFKNYIQNSSKKYYEEVLLPAFERFDAILGADNDNKKP